MDVVTIGETMVLFTPESSPLMRYAHSYSRKFGGAETNVAIGLTRLGHQSGWISKVGNDEFGKAMVSFIRGEGVDVSQVTTDETAPTGLYFKEVKSGDNVRVQYYRKGSAASTLQPTDLNEEYIAHAKYLHITGITPALSDSCYETILEAINIAKGNGVKVIFDPNLRRKLWSEEKARRVLLEIAALADIILPGVDEGNFMFGESDPEKLGQLFLDHGASLVILKVGAKGAYYFTTENSQLVPGYPVESVIDPVGAGDGFAAGVISGLLDGLEIEEAVARGNAVGALATQIQGDFEGLPNREEIEQFTSESGSEDISR
ncbi:2-dehydro-3-deoxygluconokinase [Anaerobacillus alkalilacustris]|uniref:2-dehydro-3-deoxygluconokinase n=1 Tax=Anaerobacillus alkalilacustris TaxID=393763 RepID=A0A1S2LRD2_9BACI|nr:sugar kinase [Anaerobacillus alkalilacustris]OIJ14683.1 2-dehydro-3-deoxygluconokinase [Anaerobacillus alkalilacustris]